jgi:hypothetical protein
VADNINTGGKLLGVCVFFYLCFLCVGGGGGGRAPPIGLCKTSGEDRPFWAFKKGFYCICINMVLEFF